MSRELVGGLGRAATPADRASALHGVWEFAHQASNLPGVTDEMLALVVDAISPDEPGETARRRRRAAAARRRRGRARGVEAERCRARDRRRSGSQRATCTTGCCAPRGRVGARLADGTASAPSTTRPRSRPAASSRACAPPFKAGALREPTAACSRSTGSRRATRSGLRTTRWRLWFLFLASHKMRAQWVKHPALGLSRLAELLAARSIDVNRYATAAIAMLVAIASCASIPCATAAAPIAAMLRCAAYYADEANRRWRELERARRCGADAPPAGSEGAAAAADGASRAGGGGAAARAGGGGGGGADAAAAAADGADAAAAPATSTARVRRRRSTATARTRRRRLPMAADAVRPAEVAARARWRAPAAAGAASLSASADVATIPAIGPRDGRGSDDAALARAHDQFVLAADAVGARTPARQDDGGDCAAGRDALLALPRRGSARCCAHLRAQAAARRDRAARGRRAVPLRAAARRCRGRSCP